ncbi:MAG: hypothetical protein ABI360_03695 [Allobranchiibius sp.]
MTQDALRAKNPPRATPAAAITGTIVAILFLALAVVGIHDLFVTQGWSDGSPWARAAIDGVDGARRADWVVPLAVVALLIGVFLLLLSVRPRRSTHRAVPEREEAGDVWVAPGVLSALAKSAAEDAPGVLSADPRVSPRRIKVVLHTTPGADRDRAVTTAEQLITERVGSLSDLAVKVSAKEVGA